MQGADDAPDNGAKHRSDNGPIELTRELLTKARSHNVVSIVYHYSHKFSSLGSTLPYLHFETGSTFSRHNLPPDHAEVLGRCHEFIITLGKPIILSNYVTAFAAVEPELTQTILSEANRLGVFDQFMVPVFGPHDIDGVIAFGFAHEIDDQNKPMLQDLEATAASHHNRLVRHFGSQNTDVELSDRENEVLTWIARGKSGKDIATILGIQPSSVNTYTRRIFEKMGVYDRVSAAVGGVVRGLVKPS